LQSLEVSISGVGDSQYCAETSNPADCCYGFDGCKCNIFNSSFIHDFTTKGCRSSWDLDLLTPEGDRTWDTCNTSQSLACGGLQIEKSLAVFVGVTSKQIDFTAGGLKTIDIPCHTQAYGYVCENYSILPGHFVLVWLTSAMSNFGSIFDFHSALYMYSFGNGAKNDIDCADDQFYAACEQSWIGGTATKVFSQRYRMVFGSPVYSADCDSSDWNCRVGDATVEIGIPTVAPCTEEEGP
jgi:hypothetical protein